MIFKFTRIFSGFPEWKLKNPHKSPKLYFYTYQYLYSTMSTVDIDTHLAIQSIKIAYRIIFRIFFIYGRFPLLFRTMHLCVSVIIWMFAHFLRSEIIINKFIATIRIRKVIKYPWITITSPQSDIKCRESSFTKHDFEYTRKKKKKKKTKKIIAMLLSNPQTTIPLLIAHCFCMECWFWVIRSFIFFTMRWNKCQLQLCRRFIHT